MNKTVNDYDFNTGKITGQSSIPVFDVTGIPNTNHPAFKKYKSNETRHFKDYIPFELGGYGTVLPPITNPDLIRKHSSHVLKLASADDVTLDNIEDYVNDGAKEINNDLRHSNGTRVYSYPEAANTLQYLLHMSPMFPNSHRINVYRGVDFGTDKANENVVKWLKNNPNFILNGFQSTSLNPKIASYAYTNKHKRKNNFPLVLEIIANHGLLGQEGNNEFILPNRSKFRFLEHIPGGMNGHDHLIRVLQI